MRPNFISVALSLPKLGETRRTYIVTIGEDGAVDVELARQAEQPKVRMATYRGETSD